jgi:DNA repair protein RecO (recombination protein O)
MSRSKPRIEAAPAFVLHTHAYRETSLIIDIFAREHGRLSLVARGARRPKSAVRGLLQAFTPLELSWFGQGELKTLHAAEWLGGLTQPRGAALMCGFYLNELLLRLLPRDDAHPRLYDAYQATVQALTGEPEQLPVFLRRFELILLEEAGYGLLLQQQADGTPVDAGTWYRYLPESGPVPTQPRAADSGMVSGQTLLDLAGRDFTRTSTLAQAKSLMRQLIGYHLQGQVLNSRQLLLDLQQL